MDPFTRQKLAARLARESDLTRRDGPLDPVAPNHFTIHLNQRDVGELNGALNIAQELETAVEVTALARGWRLEGPAAVALQSDPSISAGMIRVEGTRGSLVTEPHGLPWSGPAISRQSP